MGFEPTSADAQRISSPPPLTTWLRLLENKITIYIQNKKEMLLF